jgi:3-hydroxyisobutyrate dehydrogenase
MKTGFVGLGAMGLPMARNLHRAGLLAGVSNRTPTKAEQLAAETGCAAAGSPEDLAAMCEAVVICVSADADVLAVTDALAAAGKPGLLVLDCSTVSSETAKQADRRMRESGGRFLDCPVSGGTEGAQRGTLSIMVGGEPDDVAAAGPILQAMGGSITHMGPVGAGQATKATNQIMVAGINQAVTEALAFGQAQGLPTDRLIGALEKGAAGNWFLSHRGPTMVRGEYPLGFKVDLHAKDLRICRAMGDALGVRLPMVEMTLIHYSRLLDEGSVDEDISALFRLKSDMFSGQNNQKKD